MFKKLKIILKNLRIHFENILMETWPIFRINFEAIFEKNCGESMNFLQKNCEEMCDVTFKKLQMWRNYVEILKNFGKVLRMVLGKYWKSVHKCEKLGLVRAVVR